MHFRAPNCSAMAVPLPCQCLAALLAEDEPSSGPTLDGVRRASVATPPVAGIAHTTAPNGDQWALSATPQRSCRPRTGLWERLLAPLSRRAFEANGICQEFSSPGEIRADARQHASPTPLQDAFHRKETTRARGFQRFSGAPIGGVDPTALPPAGRPPASCHHSRARGGFGHETQSFDRVCARADLSIGTCRGQPCDWDPCLEPLELRAPEPLARPFESPVTHRHERQKAGRCFSASAIGSILEHELRGASNPTDSPRYFVEVSNPLQAAG